jgi:lysophospholipase-2
MLPSMKSRLKDITYVFPPAPEIGISINGGAVMPGWFDLFDWPIAVGSQDDREGLAKAVQQIETEVAKLGQAGIPPSKIVVGGFSQGGAIALLTAYQRKDDQEAFAGCAGLSAWLTLPDELKVTGGAKKTPLFWGHGRMDDKVLFEQQAFGVDKLQKQGVNVIDKQYNMGHSSDPDEMEKLAEFVDKCLFGQDGSNSEL